MPLLTNTLSHTFPHRPASLFLFLHCHTHTPNKQANDVDKYWQFSKLNHELSKGITLRGMLKFKSSPTGACAVEWMSGVGVFLCAVEDARVVCWWLLLGHAGMLSEVV